MRLRPFITVVPGFYGQPDQKTAKFPAYMWKDSHEWASWEYERIHEFALKAPFGRWLLYGGQVAAEWRWTRPPSLNRFKPVKIALKLGNPPNLVFQWKEQRGINRYETALERFEADVVWVEDWQCTVSKTSLLLLRH